MVSAAIYAMALRRLLPTRPGRLPPPHDYHLQGELNRILEMAQPKYVFQACDSLIQLVKDKIEGPAAPQHHE
jgi:hypothetical protein